MLGPRTSQVSLVFFVAKNLVTDKGLLLLGSPFFCAAMVVRVVRIADRSGCSRTFVVKIVFCFASGLYDTVGGPNL